MPTGDQLSHIGIIGKHRTPSESPLVTISTPGLNPPQLIRRRLPPEPSKLISKIESGSFIKMTNLLSERLDTYCNNKEANGKTMKPIVTNILEWLQCFAIYICGSAWSQGTQMHQRSNGISGSYHRCLHEI